MVLDSGVMRYMKESGGKLHCQIFEGQLGMSFVDQLDENSMIMELQTYSLPSKLNCSTPYTLQHGT